MTINGAKSVDQESQKFILEAQKVAIHFKRNNFF